MQDNELIDRALAKVEHIAETRAAARELNVAPRTLQEWRDGKRPPMREPTRSKLISKLSGVQYGPSGDIGPARILDILDRESRAAEFRGRAAELAARAEADRAFATRLAAEGARELRWGIVHPGGAAEPMTAPRVPKRRTS